MPDVQYKYMAFGNAIFRWNNQYEGWEKIMEEEDDYVYDDDDDDDYYDEDDEPVGNLSHCECGLTPEQCASQPCPK